MDTEDEKHLLIQAQEFDEDALSVIFDRYYPQIYRYIYYQITHVEIAEDLSSQVFQRLLTYLHQQDNTPIKNLKAWLFRVAHNHVVDEIRRMKHRDHAPLHDNIANDLHSIPLQVEQNITLSRLRKLIDTLPETQRTVVIMRFLMDMPLAEVADVLDMTIGAVKAQQHRALTTLRQQFAFHDIAQTEENRYD